MVDIVSGMPGDVRGGADVHDLDIPREGRVGQLIRIRADVALEVHGLGELATNDEVVGKVQCAEVTRIHGTHHHLGDEQRVCEPAVLQIVGRGDAVLLHGVVDTVTVGIYVGHDRDAGDVDVVLGDGSEDPRAEVDVLLRGTDPERDSRGPSGGEGHLELEVFHGLVVDVTGVVGVRVVTNLLDVIPVGVVADDLGVVGALLGGLLGQVGGLLRCTSGEGDDAHGEHCHDPGKAQGERRSVRTTHCVSFLLQWSGKCRNGGLKELGFPSRALSKSRDLREA
jgi:hypothetical protein